MPRFRDERDKYNFTELYNQYFNETTLPDDGNIYAVVPVEFEYTKPHNSEVPNLIVKNYMPCKGTDSDDALIKSNEYLNAIFKKIGDDEKKDKVKELLIATTKASRGIYTALLVDNKGLRFYVLAKENREKSLSERLMEFLTGKKIEEKGRDKRLYLDNIDDIRRIAWDKLGQDGVKIHIEDEKDAAEYEKEEEKAKESFHRMRHHLMNLNNTNNENEKEEERNVEDLLIFRKPGTMDHVIGKADIVEKAVNEYKEQGWNDRELDVVSLKEVKGNSKNNTNSSKTKSKDYVPINKSATTKAKKPQKSGKVRVRESNRGGLER